MDPFFVARYQQKIGETRASILEIEALVNPLRSVVADADRRLVVLRAVEAEYLAALG